ncbi:MAG: pitrilysin family protein, partial [Acidobacteria bacterium]|nr:pitrilysin family protein [Acidobacteriota bacterium]
MSFLPERARVHRPAHHRRHLDNGLTVLIVEDQRLPAISLTLLVPAGGGADPTGQAGTASLVAGLLDKGSRRRDADSLAVAIDDLGASYSARAGRDSMAISLAGLSEDFMDLLALLGEITLESSFPATEFHLLRQRRLHALTRAMDQAATVADWTFSRGLYGEHPYGPPLSGTAASISALTETVPAAWHEQQFTPARSCLAIAGAVPAEQALKAAADIFERWQGTPPPRASHPDPAPAERRILLVDRPDSPQAQIRWGHLGISRGDPRHDAAELVNDVLGGGGFSSRLMQTIRSEKGLTYGIHSGFAARLHAGPFRVSTFTPTASVGEVLRDIDDLVGAFRADGPTATELDDARRRLVGGYPLQFETATQVAGQLLEIELYGLPEDTVESYQDRILAVDTKQAADLAHDLLHPEAALAVVVGDL